MKRLLVSACFAFTAAIAASMALDYGEFSPLGVAIVAYLLGRIAYGVETEL